MPDPTEQKQAGVGKRTMLKGGGGRQTQPSNFNPFAGLTYAFLPRRLLSGLDLSRYRPEDFAPWQLMQILADSHTDVGLALWNILRLGVTGFEATVKTLSGQDDPEGTAQANAILAGINKKSGGIKAIHIQWMLSWYLYGAVCGELALTLDLRGVLDIFAVNPFTIMFERDAITQALVMFQEQLYTSTGQATPSTNAVPAGYRRLNDALVYYTPCDPTIDDPYGRIPSATVLNEVFFDVGFLQDLQKILHGVGTPRYVIKIIEEILAKTCPPSIKNDPDRYNAWLDSRLEEVRQAFRDLEPEEALVLFDSVDVDIVSAKSGTNILGLVTPLSRAIERRLIKALKMLPILMASNEGTTETHGSVQFEIFAEGIHSGQAASASMTAAMLTLALQLAGRQCLVTCAFAPIRTANRLLAANAENKEIINAALKEALGYQTHDESSIEVTGSAAVGPALPGVLETLIPPLQSPSGEAPASARADAPVPEPKAESEDDE